MAEESLGERELARDLLAGGASASLATLEPDGCPFASHVLVAPAADGSPLMLLSRLAVHSRNLVLDSRASLLFVREPPPGAVALAAARVTLTGRALPDTNPDSRRRFLDRHPEAARYAGFADFSVYRFRIAAGHLVAGFGRIVDLSPADLLRTD